MAVALATICAVVLLAAVLAKRAADRRELERHTITPEGLHALLASNLDVLVVDVRHPLDLLGDSVIIPGAQWFAPRAVIDDPSLIPARKDIVVYCTCPREENSRAVLHRALAMGFSRIKFLKGGLDGWRARGYPVEPYEKAIHFGSDKNNYLAAAS